MMLVGVTKIFQLTKIFSYFTRLLVYFWGDGVFAGLMMVFLITFWLWGFLTWWSGSEGSVSDLDMLWRSQGGEGVGVKEGDGRGRLVKGDLLQGGGWIGGYGWEGVGIWGG